MTARLAPVLILLLCALPAWSDESPDTLVLHTGERVACTLENLEGAVVHARIGARTYAIERSSLRAVERAGTPLADAASVAFAQALGAHLVGSDDVLRKASRSALATLAANRADAIHAAAAQAKDPTIRAALQALVSKDDR